MIAKGSGLEKVTTQGAGSASGYHKLPISLTEKQYAFLLRMSLKSLTTGGKRLPHTAIIRAAVAALAEIDIDFTALRDEHDLKERIVKASKPR